MRRLLERDLSRQIDILDEKSAPRIIHSGEDILVGGQIAQQLNLFIVRKFVLRPRHHPRLHKGQAKQRYCEASGNSGSSDASGSIR